MILNGIDIIAMIIFLSKGLIKNNWKSFLQWHLILYKTSKVNLFVWKCNFLKIRRLYVYGHLYLLMKIDTTVEKVSNHFLRYQMTTIQLQSFRQHNTLLLPHKNDKDRYLCLNLCCTIHNAQWIWALFLAFDILNFQTLTDIFQLCYRGLNVSWMLSSSLYFFQ